MWWAQRVRSWLDAAIEALPEDEPRRAGPMELGSPVFAPKAVAAQSDSLSSHCQSQAMALASNSSPPLAPPVPIKPHQALAGGRARPLLASPSNSTQPMAMGARPRPNPRAWVGLFWVRVGQWLDRDFGAQILGAV